MIEFNVFKLCTERHVLLPETDGELPRFDACMHLKIFLRDACAWEVHFHSVDTHAPVPQT